MALPTGPIPLVAFDTIIEESWGDSVAQSLNNLNQRRSWGEWHPSGEDLAPTASLMTLWWRFGGSAAVDLDVPDWATVAYVRVEMNGVYHTDTDRSTYLLQLHIGPLTGRIRHTGHAGYFAVSWATKLFAIQTATGDRRLSL